MIYNRNKLPSEGEIVIGTVKQVFDYGSYLTLDEYGNMQAYLPWSEVSSKWVKNINDVLKENMKVVVKVIRVDRRKNTVDVSLKKVNDDERKKKMIQWKRIQRLDKILEIVSQKLKVNEKEAWEQVAWKLASKYGDPMLAIDKAVKEGEKVLIEAGVQEMWVKPLLEEASKHVEEKRVKVSEVITVRTLDSLGVSRIKEVISKALETVKEDSNYNILSIKIYTIGAPRYRVDVIGTDPKETSQALNELISNLIKIGKEEKVEISVIKK